MNNCFIGSYLISAIGLIFAYFWGEHIQAGSGLTAIFIVTVLGILEVSLSFDNAVVNALKLEKMPPIWQKRFLTWGIAIAVFGMRFLFPLLVVSIFANLNLLEVAKIALSDSDKYAHYLELTHAPIVTFGGAFLMLLFLHYFINAKKENTWLKIEKYFIKLDKIKYIEVIITFLIILLFHILSKGQYGKSLLISGIAGIITYEIIEFFVNFLENKNTNTKNTIISGGLIGFLYLELIDASFSLDGVLGAFALSKDILIITTGLAIGAMFVRSITFYLLKKKTLKQFKYLENGAHYAIGSLAIIMFLSSQIEIPEVITGTIGLIFILSSLFSSIKENKN